MNIKFGGWVLWLILLCLPGAASAGDLTLWYDAPAPDTPAGWERLALPIGNGRIGAMVFGGTARERIQFNDITLWTGDENVYGAYQAFGDLHINLTGGDQNISHYRRELDLADAVARVSYTSGGVDYRREYFASHPADVMVFRLTASKPGAYSGSIELSDMHNAAIAAQGDRITLAGNLGNYAPPNRRARGPAAKSTNRMAYEAQAVVVNEGGKLAVEGGTIAFNGCDALTIILGTGTSYVLDDQKKFQGDDPHARVTAQVDSAAARSETDLLAEHQKDYRRLFDRVELNLGDSSPDRLAMTTQQRIATYSAQASDPGLEAMFFQYGRYLLISCSRDTLPANLQGLWNASNTPAWNSDYHTNINIEMNYWPVEPANLSECTAPLFNFVEAMIPAYRRAIRKPSPPDRGRPAETFLTPDGKPVRGWAVRTESNPFGYMSYTWNKAGNAWYARHFWEHYAYTGDKDFLRTRAYPLMKEVCEFWQDSLKKLPDGTLVAPNGWSPEHGPIEDGVSYDQEIIWDLFDNTIHAADVLGVDKEFRDQLLQMRDHLAKPKIGSWGQLLEWMTEKHDPVLDTAGDHHRHASHLFGLYPGHQISLQTPDLLAAAKVSLSGRGDSGTEWSMAWKIAFWARLLDGDHAYTMLHHQLSGPANAGAGGTSANMLEDYPPFQIDGNFGATAGICEMLLQSQTGQIHLLPAIPAVWPSGSVKGLKARGGFEVDMQWAQGKLTGATIRSTTGDAATVRYGEKVVPLTLGAGQSAVFDGSLTLIPSAKP